jgi:hypothetical protein
MSNQSLKIATWNVMKPTTFSGRNVHILREIEDIKPDILILTETNDCINPGPQYKPFSTAPLFGTSSKRCHSYKPGERSVTIWSKFYEEAVIRTVDSPSSVCVGLRTPFGELNVYGTVVGVHGRGGEDFNRDLITQPADWERISAFGNLCIAGDFNSSLTGKHYVSNLARTTIDASFGRLQIDVPTRDIPDNIDHVALSKTFLTNFDPNPKWKPWNKARDKKRLSDHMGICITLKRSDQ